MALINIDNAVSEAIRSIEKCSEGQGLEVMSYKRNRSVSIISLKNDSFCIIEKGYLEETIDLGREHLTKYLKKAFKREFPRSRKVRFFNISDPERLTRHHQKI